MRKYTTIIMALMLLLVSCGKKKTYFEGMPLCDTETSEFKAGLSRRGFKYSFTSSIGGYFMKREITPYVVEVEVWPIDRVKLVSYSVSVPDSLIVPQSAVLKDGTPHKEYGYSRISQGEVNGLHNYAHTDTFSFICNDAENIASKWKEDEYGFSLYITLNGKETKVISSK